MSEQNKIKFQKVSVAENISKHYVCHWYMEVKVAQKLQVSVQNPLQNNMYPNRIWRLKYAETSSFSKFQLRKPFGFVDSLSFRTTGT